jgi:pectate lyase
MWKCGLLVLAGFAVISSAAANGLVNLSARAVTAEGAEALTAGFVVAGEGSKRVLVRAAGPALAALGVSGTLTQVRLEVFRGPASLATNSGWDTGAEAAAVGIAARSVGAFEFAPGSKDAALVLVLDPGNYTAQVVPAAGGARGVALVEIYDLQSGTSSRLVNLSARGRTGSGAETFIAGFVISGESRNRVLIRGIGPALTAFGVTGALANPQLEVFRDDSSVAFNDDWMANSNGAQLGNVAQQSGAFTLAATSRDAALLLPDASGAFTAPVTSASAGQSGIALLEIYDTSVQSTLPPPRTFDLVGFARVPGDGLAAMTGGGTPVSDYNPVFRTGNFWRVDDTTIAAAGANFASQLQTALSSDLPLVVELNTMIDLSRFGRPNNGATAIAHPDLFATGRTSGTVGILAVGANKTIYSAFGNGGFRRGSLTISGKSNVILRNLKFRELWEWDDATTGEYDRNDWDYLTVTSATSGATVTSRAHHIWIDHCDFEKAYDGLFDFVHGADLITVSWCKIAGAVSGESIRWVQRQMDYLEANRARFPYYFAQRATLSADDLLRREIFQKKANLVGNSADAATMAHDVGYLNVTFHHNWYLDVDQRMPRMRFGNAHVFNLLADSSAGRNVTGLTQMGVAATSNAAVRVDNSRFIDVRTAISNSAGTESPGRVTVVNSVNLDPVTRVDKGFDSTRTTPLAGFRWNDPAAATGLGDWPRVDTAVMPAGYVPPNRTLAEYVDSIDALAANLALVGVIVPSDAAEAERLRSYLQKTTAPR